MTDEPPQEVQQEDPKIINIQYFTCAICALCEPFDYFGDEPPYIKKYKLKEDAYTVEDPFFAPKQGDILILGSHCIKCNKCVCKDTNCSLFYQGTYCIHCAKQNSKTFPEPVREKLNRIVVN